MRLVDVVLLVDRKPPRIEPRFLLVSAHAWCLPSCLHMPILAYLPPAASPISCALLLNLQICVPFGESGKAVAANGAMPAPSERQRLSLPFFIAYDFFAKINEKADPFWGQIPDPKRGTFSGPLL